MRIVLYVLIFTALFLVVSVGAKAAEPKLVNKSVEEDFGLPEQTPLKGTKDFLLELRAEYPSSSVVILTHFPQGLSRELDKSLVSRAKELHLESQNEALKGDDASLEDYMAGISEALAAKDAAPEKQSGSGLENSYFSAAVYTGSRPSQDFFSIRYMIYWYSGGAHANRVYRTWTYDVRNGKEITLQDLFPGKEGVEASLGRLALKALSGKVKDLTEEMMDINMNRISMTAEGLQIVYSPYEIASYAEGEFFADIPLKELVPLGVNAAMWRRQ